ncbi:MAG: nucleotidyl transferase AbiEii/AbiGii toxin family protein [Syntrophales bacterium]|jgi:hypothetical protein
MDSFIKIKSDDQRAYFEQAEDRLRLPAASIEKDFWVCWTLNKLFELPIWGVNLTFKGGTSLSKAWGLIKRFSEDIDIVVSRDFLGFGEEDSPAKATSKKKRRMRLGSLKEACCERIQNELRPAIEENFRDILPEKARWSLEIASTEDDPDGQTLIFKYPGILKRNFKYLLPQVKIEFGARSDTWPTESPVIQPYLAKAFPNVLTKDNFIVKAIAPERTFWEKAMLLHEETFRPVTKVRKARLARHYYDLWCLIENGVAERAINAELFNSVAEHRAIFFNQNWVNYNSLRPGSLRIVPLDNQLTDWKRDYKSMQIEMFFGEVPDFEEVLRVVKDFQDNFNRISIEK